VDINNLVQTVLIYALPVLFAITIHEAAHGYVARALGDNTAYVLGRVTLNPIKHIDPVGTILMPLMLYFATSGAFLFGYAKPVPVNFGQLRRFFLEMCKAGVLTNLVMWAFNLFPLPPLDGGRVLVGLLPPRLAYSFSRIEPWGFFIVMALVIAHVVGDYWLRPLMALGYLSLDFLLSPLAALLQ
jgi:Zn-dependent protease